MKRRLKPRRSWRQGREWRRPYRKSRAVDATCRCHGSCPYCLSNRMRAVRRQQDEADDQMTCFVVEDVGREELVTVKKKTVVNVTLVNYETGDMIEKIKNIFGERI